MGLRQARWLVLAAALVVTTSAAAQGPEIAAVTNGASFDAGSVAPDTIVSIFGERLAEQAVAAGTDPLPTTLAGTTFTLTDSAGAEWDLPLFFVSAKQANAFLPAGAALGAATLTVTAEGGTSAAFPLEVAALAPGLFSADASGQGVAAAVALLVGADESRSNEIIFDGALQPVSLDLGDTGEVYLMLFGTGIRGFGDEVLVTVRGLDVPVLGAVPQEEFAGLDQVNIGPIPPELAGRGEVPIDLIADGLPANRVTAVFFSPFAYTADLSGGESVPPVSSSATGSCLAELDVTRTDLAIRCTHNVADPSAAHVHWAPPGETGPVVCGLGNPTSPIHLTCPNFQEHIQALEQGDLYVNIHSMTQPGGEIRGQLRR